MAFGQIDFRKAKHHAPQILDRILPTSPCPDEGSSSTTE
jgi:hypothetical protein